MVKHKKAFQTKLIRDMSRGVMQFLSIVLLCSLGTMLFAALDGLARMVQETNRTYFTENNLANFWVSVPQADRQTMAQIHQIPGVQKAIARVNVDMKSTLPEEPTINVLAYSDEMGINTPMLSDGTLLSKSDIRGCLLQVRFARKHNLHIGDTLTVKYGQMEYRFLIRGLVYSPEHIGVSLKISGNSDQYGFMLVNALAVQPLPLSQVLITLQPGTNEALVRATLEETLPEALVMGRNSHESTAGAIDNGTLFANLTLLFPVLAYAVACMIVMTTLTRMINNQRIQIGTLKSLGYSTKSIQRHYLSYAFWPSLAGSLLGIAVGHYLLAPIIWNILIGQSEYPYRVTPFVSMPAWGMVALSIASSVAICLHMLHKSVHEPTASLLRPKAPLVSKRLLLERFSLFWGRLGFNIKMIIRNISRNKLRSTMSCVGLLCCNALLIASFGIQDSVNFVTANHYTKTLRYTVRANLSGTVDTPEAYRSRLDADALQGIMESPVRAVGKTKDRITLLTVVENFQQTLYLGKGETLEQITPGGCALTFKLAETLNLRVGDFLTLHLPGDDQAIQTPVVQIVYNNVSQGVYMARSAWESLRKGGFTPTALQLTNPSPQALHRLSMMDEVDSLDYPADQIMDMERMLATLTGIFSLISIVALALAFVICYNMGLMNFVERIREYATLKVLGYHQKEIRKLILRENDLITCAGVLLGIGAGIALTSAILVAVQTESLYYPTSIKPISIVIACLITTSFSIFIQLFLTRKVKNVDMIEALKSVE